MKTKTLRRVACGTVSLYLAVAAAIVADGLIDHTRPSDTAIVLGSMVLPDGTASERLRARLDKTVELYRRGMFKSVIVSGGTGVEGVNEAEVMKVYLVANQVPSDAILVDARGVNTLATARNGAALMKAHGFTSAIVVTQYFHITRSRYALRAQGIRTVNTAHAQFFEWRDIYSIAREAVALPAYLISSS